MATDVERLVVSLEASITKYDRAMNKALGITNSTMQRIERRQMTAIQRVNAGWAGAQRGIATAFAGAVALRGAQQLIDASTRIENSLKVVGLEGEALSKVYDSLFSSAQRNMAPLESLTTLYSRLGLAQKELGASNDQLLDFTDKVALALRVQGTTAQEARGALIQLSQAMGSGIVRAEEFNSIVEGAPSILRATAAGLKEAGGSVAQLRTLVIDGKLSSQAFFQAFLTGSAILEDQVANAEVTVSQGFVRLQNVLIDTAGKFDTATGASNRTGTALAAVAKYIEDVGKVIAANGADIQRFMDLAFGTGPDQTVADDILEWSRAMGEVFRGNLIKGSAGEMEALAQGFDRFGESVSDADLALAQAEQSLANFADHTAGKMGEVDAAAQDLFQQVLEGKGSAELAAEAIEALGNANPDFSGLLSDIGGVIQRIYDLRNAAIVAAQSPWGTYDSAPNGGGIAEQRAEQMGLRPKPAVRPVSIIDYPVSGAAGSDGGKKSGADRFADALASQQQRIDALNRETELQRQLGTAVDDYGFSIERLRAQIDLENAAKEAGLPLDEQRQAQIDQLAEGYGRATAEAARLAEVQEATRAGFEEMRDAARSALETIVDGFLEGKDAGEIFQNVLKDVGSQLLNMGFNSLFGGGATPGSGLLGGMFGLPGRERGGPVRKGQPYIVGEKRPELFIPDSNGTIVPRLPSMPSGSGSSGPSITFAPVIDARGADIAAVARIEQVVAKQQVEFEGRVKQIVKGRGTKWR
jgi:tape measure domain-containing protein